MWFWIFMFICNLIVPLLLIIVGRMMWKHCPKKINSIVGYRTSRSMKNMDTWKFAHTYCGQLWWKIGWIMLVLSIIVQLPFVKATENQVGVVGAIICTVQCLVLIASIFPTEKALKRTFKEDGTKKVIEIS